MEIDSRILGDDDFIDRVLDRKPRRLRPKASLGKIVQEICRYFHLEEKDFLFRVEIINYQRPGGWRHGW
jgi:hypothetical protein